MQHPFFWNGVFVFWCCRDDLSFFRKGVAKICRATASLFLHAVWPLLYTLASIPGEPTIVVAHSLGAQVRGGNEQASDWFFLSKSVPKKRPGSDDFPQKKFTWNPQMKVPGSLSFFFFWMRESWNGFGSFDRFLLPKNCEAICFWCFKHLLHLSFWECSIEAGKVRSDHL